MLVVGLCDRPRIPWSIVGGRAVNYFGGGPSPRKSRQPPVVLPEKLKNLVKHRRVLSRCHTNRRPRESFRDIHVIPILMISSLVSSNCPLGLRAEKMRSACSQAGTLDPSHTIGLSVLDSEIRQSGHGANGDATLPAVHYPHDQLANRVPSTPLARKIAIGAPESPTPFANPRASRASGLQARKLQVARL
jgi:hypothetical protein